MQSYISLKGVRENNLKNIDLKIPRDQFVVLTGVSGSGKSSLAFGTLYAEGQMRYVESLSSYARQFLGQMGKPAADSIEGLSPAIAIEQKTTSNNPRSTVGTITEIYNYLRLLYARIGQPHCPKCGREIKRQSVDQIIDQIHKLPGGTRYIILAPVVHGRKGEHRKVLEQAKRNGYVRVRVDGTLYDLSEEILLDKKKKHNIDIVVDRLIVKAEDSQRLADSLETALKLSGDIVTVYLPDQDEEILFSQNFACPKCGISLPELSPRMFSFNAPYGACATCSGLGSHYIIDPEKLIPDKTRSLNQGAVDICGWKKVQKDSFCKMYYEALAERYGFDLDTPIKNFSKEALDALLYGTKGEILNLEYMGRNASKPFEGLIPNLERRRQESMSDSSRLPEAWRKDIERVMSALPCPDCHGDRLQPVILAVTVGEKSIADFCRLSIEEALSFVDQLSLPNASRRIADTILTEIRLRLTFLKNVGLEYLTLARAAGTLSGGEAQRIRLATQIGSGLCGVLYILDEPSIGLHQRDNDRLLASLKQLRDQGNTLIVVEHDEDTIRHADWVIDIGPGAGENGGEVVAQGTPEQIMAEPRSITGRYLSGALSIPVPKTRRVGNGNYLTIIGARENNLKNIDVSIPLGTFVCVTGVSGSGKSSLINEILYKKLANVLNHAQTRAGKHTDIIGIEHLDKIINIDQDPIGRTPRSNPATYIGVFDDIRFLFSTTNEAKMRAYGPGRFSFNIRGGRCEKCNGDGIMKITMHFLPDVFVPCDICKGTRYKRETLTVRYKGKNIADILDMRAQEALAFFEHHRKIHRKIEALCKVGLGYIKLGQPSTTLSGGEAQRVKLAAELLKPATGSTIYVLDEPTTGLHVADVHQLIKVLQEFTDGGNTVVVIEHNLDFIKSADYIIDLGPEGGNAGGEVICTGTPEQVAACEKSYTGQYLKKVLY
jgi:excinuclease ABC subunit A